MKHLCFIFLIMMGFINRSFAESAWSVTAENFKEVKVNGSALKKGHFWEYPSWNQIETGKSDVMISFPERHYLRLSKNSHVRWQDGVLQLLFGQVYIKSVVQGLTIQVPGFFKFKLTSGDIIVDFDKDSKKTEFSVLAQSQKVQIDSDDREILASEGSRLAFEPEMQDGEVAYDFLLNDRKIPKFHMEKSQLDKPVVLDTSHWRVSIRKAEATKKKLAKKVQIDSSKYICKQPNGQLNECFFINQDKACVRYTCNLSGQWSQKTIYDKNDLCPRVKTVKVCSWLGR